MEQVMTIGSWDPTAAETFTISSSVLEKFAQLANSNQLTDLTEQLSSEEIQQQAPIMRLDFQSWENAATNSDAQTLIALIRFFTIAEQQLAGWEGQEKSPVIYLNKVLKLRKEPLDKDMLLWIRANSNNRFLPHGAL
jgi:hypothetical protein